MAKPFSITFPLLHDFCINVAPFTNINGEYHYIKFWNIKFTMLFEKGELWWSVIARPLTTLLVFSFYPKKILKNVLASSFNKLK